MVFAGTIKGKLTVLTLYTFLYGKAYLALSGIGEDIQTRAEVLDNTALNAALITLQIGIFTAVLMILGFSLKRGFLRAHIRTFGGRLMETILSLRFFIFQYGVVHKLDGQGSDTSLTIAVAWKPIMKKLGIWQSIRSIACLYDTGMGMLIFIPIALCSRFRFISTLQTRLLFKLAFSYPRRKQANTGL